MASSHDDASAPDTLRATGPLDIKDVLLRLGSFTLGEQIAKGGMGEVWTASHTDGTPVAIKILIGRRARDPRFVSALRREVRAVAGLSHPAIVTVLDAGEVSEEAEDLSGGRLAHGSPYLVMERASGGALDQAPAPTSFARLRELLLTLLDALAHAHARGVVHRDLKPSNILVCTSEDLRFGLKLSDFGLALALDRTAGDAATAGTPAFMAPEQFRGEWRGVGPWTDLYALGCMTWYWCTRRPLFQGDRRQLSQAHRTTPLPRFLPRFDVPEGLAPWLDMVLAKEPEDRCQRAADAAWALLQMGVPEGSELPEELGSSVVGASLVALPTLTEIPDSELEVLEATPRRARSPGDGPRLPIPPMPESWDGGAAPISPPPWWVPGSGYSAAAPCR